MSDFRFSTSELGGNSDVNVTIIHIGEVVHIDDPSRAGRIKVRIPFLDTNSQIFCKGSGYKGTTAYNKVQGDETSKITSPLIIDNLDKQSTNSLPENSSADPCVAIPWCEPLMSKNFQVSPKMGEMVKVILYSTGKPQMNRSWVAPVISQIDKLNFDDVRTAGSLLNTALLPVGTDSTDKVTLNKRGDFTGGFPEPLDIAVQSRNNADIVLPNFDNKKGNISRNGEILIRAGKFKFNASPPKNGLELNNDNPAYFRLKVLSPSNSDINADGTVDTQPSTHAMLFSDFISIVSHENTGVGDRKINPLPPSDVAISSVHNSLQPLIRGDYLLDFLELVRDFIANHNHSYHGIGATDHNSKPEIAKFDLNKLKSTNIRIN